MTDWRPISLKDAEGLLDMKSGQTGEEWAHIAHEQLLGAVDLYSRLGAHRLAWLADEVGLGKTYVAMAVAALVRRQHPDARILYLLPSTRLLPKWKREIQQFSRKNVRHVDHHLRTLQDGPARPLVEVASLHELALETALEPDRDFLCTLGAFSFGLGGQRRVWEGAWERLLQLVPPNERQRWAWNDVVARLDTIEKKSGDGKVPVKVAVAQVVNGILPNFDLIICDESHNLRHGLGGSAARNRLLSVALGGVYCYSDKNETRIFPSAKADLKQRAQRVLMLTATPFRSDYEELTRQADVFGFTDHPVTTGFRRVANEGSREDTLERQREQVKQLVLRRLGTMKVDGEHRTRNQYRTEFREGGIDKTDPFAKLPPLTHSQRLVMALVQKRVLDVLRPADSSAGWKFQMGLLSSFESFGQTLDTKQQKQGTHEGETTEEGRTVAEREAQSLEPLFRSYQETFGGRILHPKLEAVAKSIAYDAWVHGEKALVFVRRVRTTEELATRVTSHIDDAMNEWLLDKDQLKTPSLRDEWGTVFEDFERYRKDLRNASDEEAPRSLFGWYFRKRTRTDEEKKQQQTHAMEGSVLGQEGLSGARPFAALFEDNPMLVLFQHDAAALKAWACDAKRKETLKENAVAYAHYNQQTGGFTKDQRSASHSAWFQAYQAAALDILAKDSQDPRQTLAGALRVQLFQSQKTVPERFINNAHGDPEDWLTLPTLISTLQSPQHRTLRMALIPGKTLGEIQGLPQEQALELLQLRSQRHMLFAQLLRVGRCYLELWLAFAHLSVEHIPPGLGVDKMKLPLPPRGTNPIESFVPDICRTVTHGFLQRLRDAQAKVEKNGGIDAPAQPISAFLELARAARHFRQLRTLNFPEIENRTPASSAVLLRERLTGLEPAIALHGGSKSKRAMEQFRMPGFPLVMVATSVVQEGVDLHTFCRKVVHYGIDGSATGTEQRNGRVDRRGSLIGRLLQHDANESIGVYFPHLRETLEPLQMAALYRRMNRFLLMANDLSAGDIKAEQQMLDAVVDRPNEPTPYPEPYKERLTSAFQAVVPEPGNGVPLRASPSQIGHIGALKYLRGDTEQGITLDWVRDGARQRWWVTAHLPKRSDTNDSRQQPLVVELHSGLDRDVATLVVESPIWPFDIADGKAATKEEKALLSILDSGALPGGTCLVSRRRSATRMNLYLRSELPLADSAEAVTKWVAYVAKQADMLEVRIARHAGATVVLKDKDGNALPEHFTDHTREQFK